MAKKKQRYETFRLVDRTSTIQHPLLVVGESFQAYRVVYQDRYQFHNKICDGTTLFAHIAENFEASQKQNTIYYKQSTSPELLATLIAGYRKVALEEEATPEAIRLLGELQPWTTREERIMAEKLKSKASAAKPDKAGLKAAAKSTPVAKGKGGGKKGNADALARARAAKKEAAGPDTRKITVLKKDHGAREGSARANILNTIYKAKTVQAAIDAGVKSGDVAWASRAGYISLK